MEQLRAAHGFTHSERAGVPGEGAWTVLDFFKMAGLDGFWGGHCRGLEGSIGFIGNKELEIEGLSQIRHLFMS